jgi:hypothetical protein
MSADIDEDSPLIRDAWVPRAPAEQSLVDSLVASLKADGVTEAEQGFTMDPETARKKMQAFQLPDPAQFLLAFVQALVARGAERVQVDIDADDVLFTADGEPFTAADLDQVFNALFLRSVQRSTKSLRQLAIGICTAEATEPKLVRVVSGGPEGGELLELRPGEPVRREHVAPDAAGTRLHVKYGLVKRIQRALELRRRSDELVELLRTRCRNARATVLVNGERVSRGLHELGFSGVHFETEACRGFVGRQSHSGGKTLVKLIQHGVWFTTVKMDELPRGTFALVDSERLSKDISQQQVVRDDAYQEVVSTLRDVLSGAVPSVAE